MTQPEWGRCIAAAWLIACLLAGPVQAQSADPAVQTLRTRLRQRLPNLPAIDEISASGLPQLYEVRMGQELYYSDAQGNYLIRRELIDTRSQRNLALGRAHRVEGVPAIVFEDRYRSRGVMSAAQIEARFAQPGGSR